MTSSSAMSSMKSRCRASNQEVWLRALLQTSENSLPAIDDDQEACRQVLLLDRNQKQSFSKLSAGLGFRV